MGWLRKQNSLVSGLKEKGGTKWEELEEEIEKCLGLMNWLKVMIMATATISEAEHRSVWLARSQPPERRG